MHPIIVKIPICRWLIFLIVLFAIGASGASGSSLVYKNFVIRYDRGWDILCEPYVVQKNDWVLKIFRQKGEIAHKDFRDFLGIFKRLNPHIRDIDMIRPGQGIDIPLRKLEHGALPGQASGVVTIPFVTLTKVKEVIKEHSQRYQVRRGDTVSRLIARKYGKYGSESYKEGVELFKAANPQIENIDLIYAGQKVYLPEPSIREQTWYANLYDQQGQLKESLGRQATPAPSPAKPPEPTPLGPKTPPAPAPQPPKAPKAPLAEAAAMVGGKLRAKGTYYLPRVQGEDFELNLFQHPMLDLAPGDRMVFTSKQKIMNMETAVFESTWPEIKTISIDDQASVEDILSAVFEALDDDKTEATELVFEGQGVHVAVRAKWVRSDADGRQLCITPISGIDQQTPESIRRFVEQNGIVIKEVLPGGAPPAMDRNTAQRHAVKNILDLAPTSQKDFVQNIARTLGFSYAPGISINFPYAGIQVQAYADLISAGSDREVFVDFGNLYGEALDAISKTGLNVIQITADDSYDTIAQKLLSALGMAYEQNPSFLAAKRSPEFNTTLTVMGLLFTKADNQRTLLSSASFHPAVTDLLSKQGIGIVAW